AVKRPSKPARLAVAARRPPKLARLPRRNLTQPALAGAALIPHAAAGAAGAVRDLSDSSLIVRLTRGRGWIAVLCALLAGIVTLNVFSLSINTTSGRVSQQISELESSNSALRASLAEELSASRIEDAAEEVGLTTAPGEAVTYLDASDDDLDKLLALLGNDTVLTDAVPDETSSTVSDRSYVVAPSIATEPESSPSEPPAPAAEPSAPASSPPSAPSGGGTTGGVGL
ncbi:MAG: hypothetical protein M3O25_08225, partial [Actinomycetota bacterium]|nr:hypothetical protein [Actinomycetota bacterium]